MVTEWDDTGIKDIYIYIYPPPCPRACERTLWSDRDALHAQRTLSLRSQARQNSQIPLGPASFDFFCFLDLSCDATIITAKPPRYRNPNKLWTQLGTGNLRPPNRPKSFSAQIRSNYCSLHKSGPKILGPKLGPDTLQQTVGPKPFPI